MDRVRSSRLEGPEVFSSPLHQRLVHQLRQAYDAILVGYRTALLDDPQLGNRLWYGRSPLRVILDPRLQLPRDLRVFTDSTCPTLVLHLASEAPPSDPEQGRVHVRYRAIAGETLTPEAILATLYTEEGVQSLLVEGGSATLESFIARGLYDDIQLEVSPRALGQGVSAPSLRGYRS